MLDIGYGLFLQVFTRLNHLFKLDIHTSGVRAELKRVCTCSEMYKTNNFVDFFRIKYLIRLTLQ